MKAAAFTDKMILVRGGGDLATGVIHKLHQSGYQVLILECDRPSAIRRHVALSLIHIWCALHWLQKAEGSQEWYAGLGRC